MEEPKSWTQLSDFTFTFHFHALEKETAAHSSVLAWRIPGTGEPGGLLLSMGSHRVGHDWSDLAAAAAAPFIWWTRERVGGELSWVSSIQILHITLLDHPRCQQTFPDGNDVLWSCPQHVTLWQYQIVPHKNRRFSYDMTYVFLTVFSKLPQ